mmetsp:Transcript_6229/g.9049  ORF Transcript_6229/g.9049 Transcript_6229/m.9049 type:complete len:123 (+) Transcript_6229:23-391(+)
MQRRIIQQMLRRYSKKVELPNLGQSTGDSKLDASIRRWRAVNTPDDESMQRIFQKSGEGLEQAIFTFNERANEEDDELLDFAAPPTDSTVHVNEDTGEINGPKGPEPTRYGDWEIEGRVSDF